MSIASLILGIFSLMCCWIPLIGFIVAIIAMIISIIAIVKKNDKYKGCAIVGIIMSIISAIISLIIIIATCLIWNNTADNVSSDVVNNAVMQTNIANEKAEINNKIKSEYIEVSEINSIAKKDYTGYINSVTKEYTTSLDGIEIEEYYERIIENSNYYLNEDFDIEVDSNGTPTVIFEN